jgi:MYXO-CTERM domain-containing protein
MWLTADFSVVRMNPAGSILSTTPTRNVARAIAPGVPNPNTIIWITEASANGNAFIGRLDFPTLAQFSIETPGELFDLVEGPDGNIWFTDAGTNDIGRLTPDGTTLAKFPIPTEASTPHGITVGPDDALWFTEQTANKIGRITTAGEILELCIPTSESGPTSIAAGSDGNVWFTETAAGKIGRVELQTSLSLADRVDSDPVGGRSDGTISPSSDQGCSVARGPARQTQAGLAFFLVLGLGLVTRRRRSA